MSSRCGGRWAGAQPQPVSRPSPPQPASLWSPLALARRPTSPPCSPPQVESPCVGPLMRVELKLIQSGLGGAWGVLVDRVVVRDVAAGTLTEFPAGGQWLGATPSPPSSQSAGDRLLQQSPGQQAVVGVQSMRLMPAGAFAATFTAR